MLRSKRKRYVLFLLLFALILGVTGVSMWRVFGRQAEQASSEALNLQPASANINALSDDEFDVAAAELYTEFAMGTEEDPQARERWFWEQRTYPANKIPPKIYHAAISEALRTPFRASANTATWQELGPAPLNELTYAGQSAQDASGRTLSVVVHPNNSNTIFIGAAQGGIWKSTDGGQTFKPVADDAPSLAIKVIRFAPNNSNIMYAGTGEPHASSSIYGRGVLKSTDGGESWSHLPSSGSGWNFEGVAISGLQIHPTDSNTIYVTTAHIQTPVDHFNPAEAPQTGIFKSTDGGNSWTLLKAATVYNANPSRLEGNVGFMDLELAQNNPNLLYATEYFGGIYKSSNGGSSWSLITPVKAGGGADFPDSVPNFSYYFFSSQQERVGFFLLNRFAFRDDLPEFSRIEIGLAQSDPNVLYAGYAVDRLALDPNNDGDPSDVLYTEAGLLFKTTDGGATWSWLGDWRRNGVPNYCSTQCSYDNTVEVNPNNANDVLIGGKLNSSRVWPEPINNPTRLLLLPWRGMVYRSLSGGSSWVDTTPHCAAISSTAGGEFAGLPYYECTSNASNKVIHSDIHAIAFDPNNANRFYVGADGGVYGATVSHNGASSDHYTWANLNNNLSTLQFYFFGDHPTDANKLIGGLQDNSVAYWNGRVWEAWGFGDGTFGAFDPQEPQHVYMGTQFNIHRHDNGGAKEALDSSGDAANGWKLSIFQVPEGDNPQFLVPFEIDPVSPNQIYAASVTGLYRSTNRGDSWSGRLNPSALEGRPTSISVSPANNDYVWVGTSTGAVYLFNFQAGVVSPINSGLPTRYVTKIEASPNNANTLYVTYSGYNANTPNTPGKVFKSSNLGQSWTDISGHLPDVPISAFAIDPQNENRMWVGSDVGVYITENGGSSWSTYRRNMPVVAIMDLKYNKNTGYLNVVTHGRGAWRINPDLDNFNPTNFLYLPGIMLNYNPSTAPPTATPTPQGAATATPTATQAPATATPTATQAPASTPTSAAATATRTATPQPSATPTQTSGGLPTVENGDFESGSGVGWSGSSTNGSNLIYDDSTTSGFQPELRARSGDWVAWLGGFHNEIGDLSQTFTIPAGESMYLHYYYQLRSEDILCGFDIAYVLVNETIVASGNLCSSNNATDWTLFSVDMSDYAGQTVTIHFRAETDGSGLSSFFVDDVSFESIRSSSSTTKTMGQAVSTQEKR